MERRQEKIKKLAIDLVVDVLGGLMLAIAIYVCSSANFPMTGVSGIALVFYHLFGLPVGTVTVLLNIPIIICCYKTLGRSFYMKSLKTTLLTSAVMDLAGPQLPVYQGDLILAAICAGVLLGVGYAIIFMRGSSTGGFDFVMMAVKFYYPHLSLGKIAFAMDTAVIVISGLVIGSGGSSVTMDCYWNYLYSTVLDKVIYGTNSGKLTPDHYRSSKADG